MSPKQIKELESIIGRLERLQQETSEFLIRDLIGIGKRALINALNEAPKR